MQSVRLLMLKTPRRLSRRYARAYSYYTLLLAGFHNKAEDKAYMSPKSLATRSGKSLESREQEGVLSQDDIAGEAEDIRRGAGSQSLAVEQHIANTWGAVLGGASTRRIEETLAAGGVSTEQGGKAERLDSLGTEHGDDFVGRVERAGEKSVWSRLEVVSAANKGADAGATVEMAESATCETE